MTEVKTSTLALRELRLAMQERHHNKLEEANNLKIFLSRTNLKIFLSRKHLKIFLSRKNLKFILSIIHPWWWFGFMILMMIWIWIHDDGDDDFWKMMIFYLETHCYYRAIRLCWGSIPGWRGTPSPYFWLKLEYEFNGPI